MALRWASVRPGSSRRPLNNAKFFRWMNLCITDLLPLGIRVVSHGIDSSAWPASRDPNITDLAAAVHRALVVRNSLLVGGPKPTLRNGAARRRSIAREVRLDSLEKILIAERLLLDEASAAHYRLASVAMRSLQASIPEVIRESGPG
jgi:hypothetical protein